MNIQQLRQSLKLKWVSYYHKNRSWLIKMRIWGTYDGQRRPSSGFILATVSVLEPQLEQIFPFILELNNNPDQIVRALGLNFNPEEHENLTKLNNPLATDQGHKESPQQTVANGKPSPSIATQVESKNKPAVSVAVATKVESNSKPMPLVAVATKVESNSKPVPLVVLTTQVQREYPPPTLPNGKPSPSIAVEVESKGKPVPSVAVAIAKDKLVTTPHQEVASEDNPSPPTSPHKIASWIDNFCQGSGWDRE